MAEISLLKRTECTYTSCYCEENVWHLCNQVKNVCPERLPFCYAVFISNKDRKIPLWAQNAGKPPDNLVVWDYHVIFIYKAETAESLVYDLDTVLEFPCSFNKYFHTAIQEETDFAPGYHRCFRVISAETFLKTFASSRSHMRNADGNWISPPPNYPCIVTPECSDNLESFIRMDPDVGWGEIHDAQTFFQRFSKKQAIDKLLHH